MSEEKDSSRVKAQGDNDQVWSFLHLSAFIVGMLVGWLCTMIGKVTYYK